MAARGFTSDMLRRIYEEAIKQGWLPERSKRSGHRYARCPHPECGYREAFSMSGRGHPHERASKLRDMRRHGFIWQGRGGEHIAEPLNRKTKET